jgi:hypothetical protein
MVKTADFDHVFHWNNLIYNMLVQIIIKRHPVRFDLMTQYHFHKFEIAKFKYRILKESIICASFFSVAGAWGGRGRNVDQHWRVRRGGCEYMLVAGVATAGAQEHWVDRLANISIGTSRRVGHCLSKELSHLWRLTIGRMAPEWDMTASIGLHPWV